MTSLWDAKLKRGQQPNKRLELTEAPAIKSGRGETSSRFEATVKLTSQRTLILSEDQFPPQLSRGR